MITTLHRPLPRTLVLVGLMGAGKTAVGKRVAARLGLGFVDADHEIETAAGCTIPDIFARYGEPAFRDLERRVIARLMRDPVQVLSTGGGAFMDPQTRDVIAELGLSVWLKADLAVLAARTAKRSNRPLLRGGDPKTLLAELMERRHPIYALADLTVESRDGPVEETVDRVLAAIDAHLAATAAAEETAPAGRTD
ncbi:shikimate kinase [Inquilinus limosus]|uniref:Shikimate kinase n=1 Tax=Inquilinus limosus TaxID=171674 RepID=A0A211Z064_9PROT|nr:shikimate kinase [Inquilinus limosus]OWJ58642.1 shikimate kinase [Inquilinus limosus]